MGVTCRKVLSSVRYFKSLGIGTGGKIMEDKKYTLTELVDQLIGPVMPVGDTTIDERYWPFAVKVE